MDGGAARRALEAAGIRVLAERAVVVPGVNIEVVYSDHDHRLIFVVDDSAAGQLVTDAWARERS